MMRVGSFLLDASPADALDALRALQRAGFLERLPAADPRQLAALSAHPLVDALRAQPAPDLDTLAAWLRADGDRSPGVVGDVHLYARLVPPARLAGPLRARIGDALGAIVDDVDARAPVDPFEFVLPVTLDDRDGARRAARFRGRRVDPLTDDERLNLLVEDPEAGEFALPRVTELRIPEDGVDYLGAALMLAQGWPRPIYLVDLDD
jgi:hypothetical protein